MFEEPTSKFFVNTDKYMNFTTSGYDTVNKPKHYMLFEDQGIEVRDVISKLVEKMENNAVEYDGMDYADYVQAMQYVMRFMDKNGTEDIKKAVWYFNKMLERWGAI